MNILNYLKLEKTVEKPHINLKTSNMIIPVRDEKIHTTGLDIYNRSAISTATRVTGEEYSIRPVWSYRGGKLKLDIIFFTHDHLPCQKCVKNVSKMCQKCVKNMSKICQKYVTTKPTTKKQQKTTKTHDHCTKNQPPIQTAHKTARKKLQQCTKNQ